MRSEESELRLFEEWLRPKLDSEETLKRYLNYAKKMGLESCGCEVNCLKKVALGIRARSKWYRNAFYNFVNYCYELGEINLEDKERLKSLARAKKKSQVSAGVQHIEIEQEKLQQLPPSVRPYIIFLYYSGLRATEVLEVKKRIGLEQCEGEFCFMQLNWSRGHKKVYVAFAPKWAWEELAKAEEVSIHYLKKVGRRIGGLKALRKHWYQKCTETCSESVCDFMQGRVKTVSAKHYNDLFKKAEACYPRVKALLDGSQTQADYAEEVVERVRTLLEDLVLRRLYYHTSDRK